jgi:hypothetical protein
MYENKDLELDLATFKRFKRWKNAQKIKRRNE